MTLECSYDSLMFKPSLQVIMDGILAYKKNKHTSYITPNWNNKKSSFMK